MQQISEQVKHELEHENIHHATLETETKITGCGEEGC